VTDTPLTVSALAGLDMSDSGMTAEDRAKLADKLKECAHTFVALKPYEIGPSLLHSLTDALATPVADVLGEVWKQHREIRDAAAKKTKGSVPTATVALIDHTLTSTLRPGVTVKVEAAGVPVKEVKIDFDVDLSLALHGVQVTISNAKITQIGAGEIKASVEIKFLKQTVAGPIERTVDLGKVVVLPGEGIGL